MTTKRLLFTALLLETILSMLTVTSVSQQRESWIVLNNAIKTVCKTVQGIPAKTAACVLMIAMVKF